MMNWVDIGKIMPLKYKDALNRIQVLLYLLKLNYLKNWHLLYVYLCFKE